MNDKRAFRLLQKEFSQKDGLYLWQGRITPALNDPYLKTLGGKQFLRRLCHAILQSKPSDAPSLRKLLSEENRKKSFTEEQFLCLPHAITLITLHNTVRQTDAHQKAHAFSYGAALLRTVDRIDLAALHNELSVLHRTLLNLNIHSYRNMDDRSQAQLRMRIVRYAKGKKLSQTDAANRYAKHPPVPDPKKRTFLALTLIFSLSLLLTLSAFFLLDTLASLLLIIPFLALSITATQSLLVRFYPPIPIFSLRRTAIPEKAATLVVITALLTGTRSDQELFSKLKKYYYRNRFKNLTFGILADLPESNHTDDPLDDTILKNALDCLSRLKKECGDHFCLFIRRRCRCATEEKYLGWERKRGAILELCRAARQKEHSFAVCTLSDQQLQRFRYLITLDTDTELGMGSAADLIFTMLHPDNTAKVNNKTVVSGYGILQPRMICSLSAAGKTPFTVLQTGSAGKEGYSTYAQDFDQNTFGKSNFCGKGILDIDAFLKTVDGAFPEEKILSHDLLEATRMRSGALCDITFSDSVPTSVISYFKRQHRWMRGDIQSLPFAFSSFRNAKGKKEKNPIDLASRLQIFRNFIFLLRPVFCFFCLVYALFLPPAYAYLLFLFATLHLTVPFIQSLLSDAHHANRRFYSSVLQGIWMAFGEMLYGFSSLAESALLHWDALLRSLYRMLISKKHLLQWVTAEHTELKGKNSLLSNLLFFKKSLFIGILFLIFSDHDILSLFGAMTLCFPLAAYRISRPIVRSAKLTKKDEKALKNYAVDAYGYYTAYVNEQTHYLPPDNYQYTPVARLANRTSPTNIGMYLLSTLAARDMEILNSQELYTRLRLTLTTLEKLPKYRGHLYNWYDTKTLDVLGSAYISTVDSGNFIACLVTLKEGILEYAKEEKQLLTLTASIQALIDNCDFSFLYNKERHLFCIGYDSATNMQSENCYDLYMSEARTTSYYCIAKGITEAKHWQYLSRPLLKSQGHMGMASWSGTSFEFFMPMLFLPNPSNSLQYECLGYAFYEQTNDKSHGLWGRSESGYYAFDNDLNYQYKAFGCHSLSLDPSSVKHDVIAPYAGILCLACSHTPVMKNLQKMKDADLYGPYGFYEAIDFTPSRVGGGYGIVRSYMAHHVGMSILSIANTLYGNRFVHRFMRDPEMGAADELLMERIPVDAPIKRKLLKRPAPLIPHKNTASPEDFLCADSRKLPRTAALLSRDLSLIANSEGFVTLNSRQYALTYPLCDERSPLRGLRLLIQTDKTIIDAFSCQNGKFGRFEDALVYQNTTEHLRHQAAFTLCCDQPIMSLTLEMEGDFTVAKPLLLSEVILAPLKDWQSHPCYVGLFTECFYRAEDNALLYRKRPKSENEKPYWLIVTMEGGGFDFITRRDEALGAMYGEEDLRALFDLPFSSESGQCIFPYFALRRYSECARGKFLCEFLFAAGEDAEALLSHIRRYRKEKRTTVGALFAPSYTHCIQKRLLASGYDRTLIAYEQIILSSILGNTKKIPERRLYTGKDLFWKHGISTDLPMIALYCKKQLSDPVKRILKGFLKTQKFLSLGGFQFDLLIFYKETELYGCPYQKSIEELILSTVGESALRRKGGVFPICDADTQNAAEYLCPIFWNLDDDTVIQKLVHEHSLAFSAPSLPPLIQRPSRPALPTADPLLHLLAGTFMKGNRYRVTKSHCKNPQSFIYCSHQFGTLLTQNSAGTTYFRNAGEFPLTARNTDVLLDMNGERLILHESECRYDLCAAAHTVDFTPGCAVYCGETQNILYELRIGCDAKLPVKAVWIRLENKTDETITLSLQYKLIPSLGKSDVIHTREEADTVFYRSLDRYGQKEEFGMYVCRIGVPDRLAPKQTVTCHCLLGVILYQNDRCYYTVREKLATPSLVLDAFSRYEEHYRRCISKYTLHSGSSCLDLMFNYYVPYQILTARIYARTGFYQCSGAYGFRDQLQDCLNILPLYESPLRFQILRCAARQYAEGDVQHWWHDSQEGPHGMRTRCSDDLVWLVYATAEYVAQTGKTDILAYKLPYLQSPVLGDQEDERYEKPQKTAHRETLTMHCLRALDLALSRKGEHGLPLIGSGDWNDGMNGVGKEGKGESVWLAMFLVLTLEKFCDTCLSKEEEKRYYREEAKKLRTLLTKECFENDRFLRGYFDNGMPLGAAQNEECRIDLLPQAFSVFLFGKNEQTKRAMESAYRELFDPDARIFKLFTPPFDKSQPNPGYIRGYLSGIRENGGQYTHAAMWGSLALFALGQPDRAYTVLCAANPACRYLIPSLAGIYRLEPYALAGDIYAGQHAGRGGWSLYTGAAGWFYTAVLSGMLGYRSQKGKISLSANLPACLSQVTFQYESEGSVQSHLLCREENEKTKIQFN